MHPRVQSLLADFAKYVVEDYDIHFIIETHSEYLVRRSQVLVGDAKYKDEQELYHNNPFSVYYFDESRGVYDMKYQTTGAFVEKFGPGFIDVAPLANMQILMNVKNQMMSNV